MAVTAQTMVRFWQFIDLLGVLLLGFDGVAGVWNREACAGKVYIYEGKDFGTLEGRQASLLEWDRRSIYSVEQRIFLSMLASECRTLNMEVARWFYVPAFPTRCDEAERSEDVKVNRTNNIIITRGQAK